MSRLFISVKADISILHTIAHTVESPNATVVSLTQLVCRSQERLTIVLVVLPKGILHVNFLDRGLATWLPAHGIPVPNVFARVEVLPLKGLHPVLDLLPGEIVAEFIPVFDLLRAVDFRMALEVEVLWVHAGPFHVELFVVILVIVVVGFLLDLETILCAAFEGGFAFGLDRMVVISGTWPR